MRVAGRGNCPLRCVAEDLPRLASPVAVNPRIGASIRRVGEVPGASDKGQEQAVFHNLQVSVALSPRHRTKRLN